ncbi:acyl-CoA dehydrogenase family protein [Sporichthya brevicatena]|uniref:Acyl-CoA dehydrogenase family protein n=1 Tax=Sporichthya brevicatena TaxID=171442 RepID=A0ABN1GZK5_9ACTN
MSGVDPAVLDERTSDLSCTTEELEVRQRVRRVLAEHVRPYVLDADRTGAFPHSQYRALVDAGLGALPVAKSDGGNGCSTAAYAIAMEEITAVCGATSLVYMTQMHTAWPILRWGNQEQRDRFVPALCSGDIYGAIAISEPSGGSDVASLRTSARPDGDGYLINGAKTFITSGDVAGVIVVFATVDRSLGRRGVTAFLVEPERGGVTASRPMSKMGMHGSSTVELAFEDCRVPASAVLGEVGAGFPIAMSSVVKTRISAAGQGLGLATGALRAAVGWADERGLLDPRSPQGQPVQAELATLRAQVLAGRLLLLATARLVDTGDGSEVAEVSMAKLSLTELAVSVCDRVVDLMGGDGDRCGFEAERLLRDALVTRIYDGTNQIQQLLIARDTHTRTRAASSGSSTSGGREDRG